MWPSVLPKSYVAVRNTFPQIFKQTEKVCPICFTVDRAILATTSDQIVKTSGRIVHDSEFWRVEIVNDDATRARGLSDRGLLDRKMGMLFVFPDMNYRQFWMKDMLIYLDMIFIDENWKVVLIEENLSPDSFPKIFGNNVKSKYVLEINSGEAEIYNLKVGDELIFLND